jgi:hypothetical protein
MRIASAPGRLQATVDRLAEAVREDPGHPGQPAADQPARRVRHQARDAATVMAFSAATSIGVAAFLLFLTVLARQA